MAVTEESMKFKRLVALPLVLAPNTCYITQDAGEAGKTVITVTGKTGTPMSTYSHSDISSAVSSALAQEKVTFNTYRLYIEQYQTISIPLGNNLLMAYTRTADGFYRLNTEIRGVDSTIRTVTVRRDMTDLSSTNSSVSGPGIVSSNDPMSIAGQSRDYLNTIVRDTVFLSGSDYSWNVETVVDSESIARVTVTQLYSQLQLAPAVA